MSVELQWDESFAGKILWFLGIEKYFYRRKKIKIFFKDVLQVKI